MDEGRSDVTHVIGSSELTVSIFAAVNLHPHHAGLVNDVLNVVTVLADYLRCNSKDVIWRKLNIKWMKRKHVTRVAHIMGKWPYKTFLQSHLIITRTSG